MVMYFKLIPDLPNSLRALRRAALLVGILFLLGAVLAGSLGNWRDYSDLDHAGGGFNVVTVSSEAGVSGDIEPVLFPEMRLVVDSGLPEQVVSSHDARPLHSIYAPHDRPPALS